MSNILFCVTGPSGSGKTSIMKEVMKNEVGSITSRPIRDGEVDGREYSFLTSEDFKWLLAKNQLAEWTEYDGNYYGTTKQELKDKLDNGHAYVICDNHGFQQFKKVHNNVISIFLYADRDDCFENMMHRGDITKKVYQRLSTYEQEMTNKNQYDYVIKNVRGYKEMTVGVLQVIVATEIHRNGEPK